MRDALPLAAARHARAPQLHRLRKRVVGPLQRQQPVVHVALHAAAAVGDGVDGGARVGAKEQAQPGGGVRGVLRRGTRPDLERF